jgi:hypothetical protein
VTTKRGFFNRVWRRIKTDYIPFFHHEEGLICNDARDVILDENCAVSQSVIDTWRFGTTTGNNNASSIEQMSSYVNYVAAGYKSVATCRIFTSVLDYLYKNVTNDEIRKLNARPVVTKDESGKYKISKTFWIAARQEALRMADAADYVRLDPRIFQNTLHYYV